MAQNAIALYFTEAFGSLSEKELIRAGHGNHVHGSYAEAFISLAIIALCLSVIILFKAFMTPHHKNRLWYIMMATFTISVVSSAINIYLLSEFNHLFREGHVNESTVHSFDGDKLRGSYGVTTVVFNTISLTMAAGTLVFILATKSYTWPGYFAL